MGTYKGGTKQQGPTEGEGERGGGRGKGDAELLQRMNRVDEKQIPKPNSEEIKVNRSKIDRKGRGSLYIKNWTKLDDDLDPSPS